MIPEFEFQNAIVWRLDNDKIWSYSEQKFVDTIPPGSIILRTKDEQSLSDYLNIWGKVGPVEPRASNDDRIEALELIVQGIIA